MFHITIILCEIKIKFYSVKSNQITLKYNQVKLIVVIWDK